jgi:hypothetical protein
MAAAALTPRVRVMVVCEGIRPSRAEDGVFHLQGVRNYIAAASFPFVPRPLWLYLVLSSPRKGKYPGYVRVIDDQADQTISFRKIDPVPVFHEGVEFLYVPVPLACRFAHPGRYLIQVWFFQQEAADVLKAEQPFDVLQEA